MRLRRLRLRIPRILRLILTLVPALVRSLSYLPWRGCSSGARELEQEEKDWETDIAVFQAIRKGERETQNQSVGDGAKSIAKRGGGTEPTAEQMGQEGQERMDLAEDFATDSDLCGSFDDELAKRDVIGEWSVPPE